MIDSYSALKDSLDVALARLASFAANRSSTLIGESAIALQKKLADERFNVVVVGEFKRGKTTFVNALLGTEILPSAVVPLTSVATALVWGADVRVDVMFADGHTEVVDVADLPRYVTERGNPSNERGVDRVLVSYPSVYLSEGMLLVDTPGVGSVYTHNTDAAYAFVPEADAAIFLTSADPPISAYERAFLEDVRDEASRMFFVLNKIDYLSGRDREESLAFTRTVLAEAVGHEVPVFPVSARQALEAKVEGDDERLRASGLVRFEEEFQRFLLRERGATILQSVAGSARKLVADEANSLDVQARAAVMSAAELDAATESIERVFEEASARRRDLSVLLRTSIDEILRVVEQDLAEVQQRETPRLLAEGDRFLQESADVRRAAREIDDHLKRELRRIIDRWRVSEDRKVSELYRIATARLEEETGRLVKRTVDLCGELLGIEFGEMVPASGFARQSHFSYAFFEVPTIVESILPDVSGILPERWSRSRALKRLRERAPLMVDKHCGRLRWDFAQRLESSLLTLRRQLDQRLDATVQSLQLGLLRAAEERGSEGEQAATAASRVAALRDELVTLNAELARIAARAAAVSAATEEDVRV